MINMIIPSILNADNMNLGHDIDEAMKSGIKAFHIDVMDGHFVPNLSYGPELVKDFNIKFTNVKTEIHLMSNALETTIPLFVNAKCDLLEFHLEATKDPQKWIDYLHKNGIKAGMAINPETDIDKIKPYISDLDQVLVMTVKPGFGGQSFRADSKDRIKELKNFLISIDKDIPIEVDGGIDDETASLAKKAGATNFVVGSYIFKKGNIKEQIRKIEDVI